MILRQLGVIDAKDDRQIGVVSRRRDEDALGARLQMRGGFVPRGEEPGAFECDIDIELFMRQFMRIADRGHFDRPGAAIDRVFRDLDFAREPAMHGIEPQQMGIGLDGAEIIDGDDLNVLAV